MELKTTITKKTDNKIFKLKIRLLCVKASINLLRNHQIRKPLADIYQN